MARWLPVYQCFFQLCLNWGFTAQSTKQGLVECSQIAYSHFPGLAKSSKPLISNCAETSASDWKSPFLNHWKWEKGRIIMFPRNYVAELGFKLAIHGSAVGRATGFALEPGFSFNYYYSRSYLTLTRRESVLQDGTLTCKLVSVIGTLTCRECLSLHMGPPFLAQIRRA